MVKESIILYRLIYCGRFSRHHNRIQTEGEVGLNSRKIMFAEVCFIEKALSGDPSGCCIDDRTAG